MTTLGCSSDIPSSYLFYLRDVWSMLHHGSVGRVQNKVNNALIYFQVFLTVFVVFQKGYRNLSVNPNPWMLKCKHLKRTLLCLIIGGLNKIQQGEISILVKIKWWGGGGIGGLGHSLIITEWTWKIFFSKFTKWLQPTIKDGRVHNQYQDEIKPYSKYLRKFKFLEKRNFSLQVGRTCLQMI